MANMGTAMGTVFLGGLLLATGCDGDGKDHCHGAGPATPPEPAQRYQKIDDDTFVIKGEFYCKDAAAVFGANLAEFRKREAGEFLLLPADTETPMSHPVLAIRKTETSENGKENTVELVLPGR